MLEGGFHREKSYGQKSKFCAENALKIILLIVLDQGNSPLSSENINKTIVEKNIFYLSRPQYA
jgi:hypothetical protein